MKWFYKNIGFYKNAGTLLAGAVVNGSIMREVIKQNDKTNKSIENDISETKKVIEEIVTEKEKKLTPKLPEPSSLNASIAGLISGTCAAITFFPTEALKKRSQSLQPLINFKAPITTWMPTLYTGSSSFAASVGPTTLVQSTVYTQLKNLYVEDNGYMNTGIAMLSGASGAVCSALVENLILKQQQSRNAGKPSGPLNAYRELNSYGYFKPWTGFSMLAFREGVFGGLALSQAESFALWTEQHYGGLWYFPAKITIGIFGALVTHPADTVATLQQKALQSGNERTIPEIIRTTYKQEGIGAFYRGAGYRVVLFTGCMVFISGTKKHIEKGLDNLVANYPKADSDDSNTPKMRK